MHLIGITFYAIFASGELQPWAEQIVEEKKVWSPSGGGEIYRETEFVSFYQKKKYI